MKRSGATGSAGGPPAGHLHSKAAAGPAALSTLMPSFIPASKETSRVMTQVASPQPHLGWHSRGFLPHWDHPGMIQGVTYRLCDAVPAPLIGRCKSELGLGTGSASRLLAGLSYTDPAALAPAENTAATDHRNAEHYLRAIRYIEDNPVEARLVTDPAGWPWSSAKFRTAGSTGSPPAGHPPNPAAAAPAALPDSDSTKP